MLLNAVPLFGFCSVLGCGGGEVKGSNKKSRTRSIYSTLKLLFAIGKDFGF